MFGKILWAVDAYPENQQLQEKGARAVRVFADGLKASVEAAWVQKPVPPPLILPSAPLTEEPLSKKTTERNLRRLVNNVMSADITPARTLHSPGPSMTSMVDTLIEHARRESYDAIAVITHARKGVSRWFLGSFAETLILRSPLPTLVSRAKTPKIKSFEHILFPTDFSTPSREVFEQVVAMAKTMACDVLLLHQVEFNWAPVGYPFTLPPVDLSSLKQAEVSLKNEGETWVEWARTQGVRVRFHLGRKPGDAAMNIIAAAKKLPNCLIAMASQSGRAESLLLGSVARRVVRGAGHPVLVIHPSARAESAAKPSNLRHAILS